MPGLTTPATGGLRSSPCECGIDDHRNKNVLVAKLRKIRKLYARTRKNYPEIARQCKRNAQAIEKQIKLARA